MGAMVTMMRGFFTFALFPAVAGAVLLCSLSTSCMHAQVTGPNGNGGPETKLNLSGLGNINNNTPTAPAQRVLQGVVQDKDGVPLKGATVYLKDDRSKKVRSMTADEKGSFRFVQLSRTAEYEIWATVQDKKSATKSVTSFETRDDITRNLKVE